MTLIESVIKVHDLKIFENPDPLSVGSIKKPLRDSPLFEPEGAAVAHRMTHLDSAKQGTLSGLSWLETLRVSNFRHHILYKSAGKLRSHILSQVFFHRINGDTVYQFFIIFHGELVKCLLRQAEQRETQAGLVSTFSLSGRAGSAEWTAEIIRSHWWQAVMTSRLRNNWTRAVATKLPGIKNYTPPRRISSNSPHPLSVTMPTASKASLFFKSWRAQIILMESGHELDCCRNGWINPFPNIRLILHGVCPLSIVYLQ